MFALGRRFPSCKMSADKLKRIPPQGYRTVPIAQVSALLRGMECIYNRLWLRQLGDTTALRAANKLLLKEMRRCCQSNRARFLVVCLDRCPDYYEFLYAGNFQWVATEISLYPPNASPWTLFPIDSHPNQAAHALWAQLIADALPEIMSGRRVSPRVEDLQSWKPGLDRDSGQQEGSDIYPLY